jgi:hypothetical protein
MAAPTHDALVPPTLRCGIELRVEEDACQVLGEGKLVSVRSASQFPAPRTERSRPVTWSRSRRRRAHQPHEPGTRAYLSAGLPGADWWVAGGAVARAENADVELGEVVRFYTARHLLNAAFEL